MTAIRPLLLALAVVAAMMGAAPARAQSCAGDCDGNGSVSVEELILGVRIALGSAALGDCLAMDSDDSGTVAINELLAAVHHALEGCGAAPSPTATPIGSTPTPTSTTAPTADSARIAAALRVATDPIFRVFDLQESVLTAVVTAAHARRSARTGSGDASGCQQLDCQLSGTQEVCCSDTQFSQTFDHCSFDDAGGTGTVNGQFTIDSSSSTLCSGGIPLEASFVLTLDSFTHDVAFGSGFLRSFHQLSETYDKEVVDCTPSPPDLFGFGLRGTGTRVLNGVLRRFQLNTPDELVQDFESGVDTLQIGIGSNEQSQICFTDAVINGTVRGADFRDGTQFSTTFTNFHVLENPQDDGTMLLQLGGRAATDCLGPVQLATVDPLRIDRGAHCFTSGLLGAHIADQNVAASYGGSGSLDLDVGADGSPDAHFASCTDVAIDQCPATTVGLCSACTTGDECQSGLACLACAGDCTGSDKRCAFIGTFITCADGDF